MRRSVASLTATLMLSLCSVAPAQLPAPVTEPPAASIFGEGARPLPELPPEVTASPAAETGAKAAVEANAVPGLDVDPFVDPFLKQQAEPAPAPTAVQAPAQKPATAPTEQLRRIPDTVELPELTEPTVGFQVMDDEPDAVKPFVSSPPVQYEPRIRRVESRTQELIFQRAALRAQQRLARQETRKWQGVSLARPGVVHGTHSENLNRGMRAPAGGAFVSPAWLRAIR